MIILICILSGTTIARQIFCYESKASSCNISSFSLILTIDDGLGALLIVLYKRLSVVRVTQCLSLGYSKSLVVTEYLYLGFSKSLIVAECLYFGYSKSLVVTERL